MTKKPQVIDAFLAQYLREYDFDTEAARVCGQQVEAALEANGIRAIVSFRAKRPDRLKEKIVNRDKTKNYASVNEIYTDIIDLAGVRIALYFPGDRQEVEKLVNELFRVRKVKRFPERRKKTPEKTFDGYKATHYRVQIRENSVSDSDLRFAIAIIEIQVASLFMHAWAEVEHDLVYKPLSGHLSEDELMILDELNGLVLAGEIALERLQKVFKQRIETENKPFKNEFELAAFIYDVLKLDFPTSSITPNMGGTHLLMAFLRKVKLDTPSKVKMYLADVVLQNEKRPIAEQLIDIILAESPKLYANYDKIKQADEPISAQQSTAVAADSSVELGRFITKWIELEKLVRKIAKQDFRWEQSRTYLPPRRIVSELKLLPASDLNEFSRLSDYRNRVIHGVHTPDKIALTELIESVTRMHKKLQRKIKKPKKS